MRRVGRASTATPGSRTNQMNPLVEFDRSLGIAVRTSADFGDGPWVPGMKLHRGQLWAGTVEGQTVLAFEHVPGRALFGFAPDDLKSVRKVASGLNVVVE